MNYYEDKYFISLFAHFKHTLEIYYHRIYTQIIIKKINDKWFEMHFFREHFWRSLKFWNAFFERAILMCTYGLKCIFWGSNLFRINGCWLVWLMICLTVWTKKNVNIFFIKVFTTSKTFVILTCINTNLRYITNWLQSS